VKKIVIIDYGCGNLLSIERAIKKVGYNSIVSRDLNELRKATHIILPGVGAFGNAISLLKEYSLIEIIKKHNLKEMKPLLGICLGLQLLF
jgi:glutamine amidotransferase